MGFGSLPLVSYSIDRRGIYIQNSHIYIYLQNRNQSPPNHTTTIPIPLTYHIASDLSSIPTHSPTHPSLRHQTRHTPPKITPPPPPPLPRIRIHDLEPIPQPRRPEFSNIRRLPTKAHRAKCRSPRLVQIQLQRLRKSPHRKFTRRTRGPSRIRAVGNRGRDGGVILCDEISPDGLEGAVEIWALVGSRGAEVGGYVAAVLGAGDGILVFVGCAVVVCEGRG